jgi:RHS repeat-associated protein
VWDGWDCVREVSPGADCIYHIPDGVLHSFSLNGTVYQLHTDSLGSVRMVTDSSGAVVARFEYGAWGEEIFSSVDSALTGFAYRFVGGLGVRTDSGTGLVYMRHRWYDVGLMRFVSRDPIGLEGGANLYRYVGNSPVSWADPSGLVRSENRYIQELINEMYLDWTINKWFFGLDKRKIDLEILIGETPIHQSAFYDPECRKITISRSLFLDRRKKYFKLKLKALILHETVHAYQHLVRYPRFGELKYMTQKTATINGLTGKFHVFVNTELEASEEEINYLKRELNWHQAPTPNFDPQFDYLNTFDASDQVDEFLRLTANRETTAKVIFDAYRKDYGL